jgi:hypothetical protein
MVIVAPKFGNTYSAAIWRVIGTIFGAIWAVCAVIASRNNIYAIVAFSLVIGLVMYYVRLNSPYPRVGIVSLVTFIVVVFNQYYDSNGVLEDVYRIAYTRAIMVVVGVIFGLVMSRALWPYLARQSLRKHLATTLENFGLVYTKISNTFVSLSPTNVDDDIVAQDSEIFDAANPSTRTSQIKLEPQKKEQKKTVSLSPGEETEFAMLRLQVALSQLKQLVLDSKEEPRIKGKFPAAIFNNIIGLLQHILDRYFVISSLGSFDQTIIEEIIIPTEAERIEMIKQVILLFYILSNALYSRTPLPHYLPHPVKARAELLQRFYKLPLVTEHKIFNKSYVDYYAFGEGMKEIVLSLEKISDEMKKLFGENPWTRPDVALKLKSRAKSKLFSPRSIPTI